MKQSKFLLTLITLAVLFRLYCISLPGFKIDLGLFEAWAARLADIGPVHFYAPGYFTDYFPGYLYILWFLGKTFPLLSHSPISSVDFEHYLKFTTNLFDFGTAFLIYKIVAKKDREWGLTASFLYLINPA